MGGQWGWWMFWLRIEREREGERESHLEQTSGKARISTVCHANQDDGIINL